MTEYKMQIIIFSGVAAVKRMGKQLFVQNRHLNCQMVFTLKQLPADQKLCAQRVTISCYHTYTITSARSLRKMFEVAPWVDNFVI